MLRTGGVSAVPQLQRRSAHIRPDTPGAATASARIWTRPVTSGNPIAPRRSVNLVVRPTRGARARNSPYRSYSVPVNSEIAWAATYARCEPSMAGAARTGSSAVQICSIRRRSTAYSHISTHQRPTPAVNASAPTRAPRSATKQTAPTGSAHAACNRCSRGDRCEAAFPRQRFATAWRR